VVVSLLFSTRGLRWAFKLARSSKPTPNINHVYFQSYFIHLLELVVFGIDLWPKRHLIPDAIFFSIVSKKTKKSLNFFSNYLASIIFVVSMQYAHTNDKLAMSISPFIIVQKLDIDYWNFSSTWPTQKINKFEFFSNFEIFNPNPAPYNHT
jgi:hypothetical protein